MPWSRRHCDRLDTPQTPLLHYSMIVGISLDLGS
jgi:hypothetical protein